MLATHSSSNRFVRYVAAGCGGLMIVAGLWIGSHREGRSVVESGRATPPVATLREITTPTPVEAAPDTSIIPTARLTFVEAVPAPIVHRDSLIQPVAFDKELAGGGESATTGVVLAAFEVTAIPSTGPATFRGDIEPLETSP